jgi:hypothetical protein
VAARARAGSDPRAARASSRVRSAEVEALPASFVTPRKGRTLSGGARRSRHSTPRNDQARARRLGRVEISADLDAAREIAALTERPLNDQLQHHPAQPTRRLLTAGGRARTPLLDHWIRGLTTRFRPQGRTCSRLPRPSGFVRDEGADHRRGDPGRQPLVGHVEAALEGGADRSFPGLWIGVCRLASPVETDVTLSRKGRPLREERGWHDEDVSPRSLLASFAVSGLVWLLILALVIWLLG